MALTWPSVSEPGRCVEPIVWTLLRLPRGAERLEATGTNLRSIGQSNAEIVNFLQPPAPATPPDLSRLVLSFLPLRGQGFARIHMPLRPTLSALW